ncbi:F-box/WD repeat-containing protein 9-like [Bombus huntii]|uniref:F-box/WD repeat-containing protein 9-like n=1 Tax=Bombus huntii TaxID=85661 RepID=UPI0021AABF59|nr:F-box/WD repeat-containing protein 9-like [Bombus huntii]
MRIQGCVAHETKTTKMCDENESRTRIDTDQTNPQLSLSDLPVEIFLHICSFLDASTLVHGLSLVCKQFHQILNNNSLWKVRITKIWPDTGYPVLPPVEEDELFWKLSCVALEKQTSLWRNENVTMQKLSFDNVQYSTIDGLLLMQGGNICISGARDRSLVCWKLPTKENETETFTSIEFAHNGWIWDLAAIDNTVYSCSWDQSVKAWTLTSTGLVHFKTYEMIVGGALLCVASCPELSLFATGSFCKTILVFDSRLCKPIISYQPHKRAVIKLAMSSHFILSASEDRTVSIWDQRAGRIMKNVTISQESFPMSMCMQRDMIYVGDGSAKLHVLDPRNNFKRVKCYTTEHEKGINGVHSTPGCLITSSMDQTVRISSPTDPPQHLTTLKSTYGEIANTDYLNDVLAVSGTEGIEIWRPRSQIQYA